MSALGLLLALVLFIIPAPLDPRSAASGNTIRVPAGGDLQAALEEAKPGDQILLEPGAAYKGPFTLPVKPGNEFITVRPAGDAHPPPGERIDPEAYRAKLPRLVAGTKGAPVLGTSAGAHHFRFIALEFGPTIDGLYNIIQIGSAEESSLDDLPHHIEFDRVYIHGDPSFGQRRGIAANGRFIRIVNSHISDIKREGEESQAIAAWATDGPVHIINNYLEAGAENVLFGGAAPKLDLVPADCEVRDNHMNKPLEWKGTKWVVKNLFEIKNGRRIKVVNNLMTNNWAMAQDGFAVLFTTREESGANAVIEDIDFTGNIVRGSAGGVNVYGSEGGGGHRLNIVNNFFEDISGERWGGAGHFLKVTEWDGMVISNNTILQSGSITVAYGEPVRGFVFRNNVVYENEYGFFGDDLGPGRAAVRHYFPGAVIDGNIILGGTRALYEGSNLVLDSVDQLGFADPGSGDLRIRPDSKFGRLRAQGRAVGADLDPKQVGRTPSRR